MALFMAKQLRKGHAFREEGRTGNVADLFPPKTYKGSRCPLEREQAILLLQGGKNTLEAEKRMEKWVGHRAQFHFDVQRGWAPDSSWKNLTLLFPSLFGSSGSSRLFHSSLNNCISVKPLDVTGCYFSTFDRHWQQGALQTHDSLARDSCFMGELHCRRLGLCRVAKG